MTDPIQTFALPSALDALAIGVGGISGALHARRRHMDLMGILVVSFRRRRESTHVVKCEIISHRIYLVETMNLTHTAVLTVAFVLRLKPQGEGVMQILFPKLKLGANYFYVSFPVMEINY